MKIDFEIEKIEHSTTRVKVFGGWIVVIVSSLESGQLYTSVFIPDSKHEWEIGEIKRIDRESKM